MTRQDLLIEHRPNNVREASCLVLPPRCVEGALWQQVKAEIGNNAVRGSSTSGRYAEIGGDAASALDKGERILQGGNLIEILGLNLPKTFSLLGTGPTPACAALTRVESMVAQNTRQFASGNLWSRPPHRPARRGCRYKRFGCRCGPLGDGPPEIC